jgi:ATP-dependent exoDNAse (exonuclease V) beta subunit
MPGVRIMKVHGAKGLEFPAVVLADMTAREVPEEPSRFVDSERRLCAMRIAEASPAELVENAPVELAREREEATRLAYVAATRARDVLVVPVVGDEPVEGWQSALRPALYPPPERAGAPETREVPMCPPFGTDSVLDRPRGVQARPVSPGRHRPEVGEHRVVWWDPAALRLSVEEVVGIRQQALLKVDEGGVRSEEGIRAHARWQEDRTRVRGVGASPGVRVVTATEAAALAGEPEGGEVALETVAVRAARPGGKRFGTLVHAVLATVGLEATAEEVRAMAEVQGRLLAATSEEVSAAAEAATRALEHSLLRRAALASRCRRETPLSLRLDDGALLEGTCDLAFEEGGIWTVVDFKTDAEIEERLSEYQRQVAWYACAIAQATGAPTRAVLLQV